MRDEVLPLFMFPPIDWWQQVVDKKNVAVSAAARYEKGSLYNRYRIATANGPLYLTVPLAGGRLQKRPVAELQISYAERWQHQHRQTIISAYGRAPHFEALWFLIEPLFEIRYDSLVSFNLEALRLMSRALQLKVNWQIQEALPDAGYVHQPSGVRYRQVFEARHGFLDNMSALDLMFCGGNIRN